MENWKAIPGYEGRYEVSDLGRVRSLQILKPGDSHGYERIQLRKVSRGKQKHFFVHCLVMLAFVGPPPPGKEVNHKLGKRKDNRLSQLEYMTKKEQQIHARDVLKKKFQYGSEHGMHKLVESQVLEIRRLSKTMSQRQLSEKFKVNIPSISLILNRKTWRHI